MKKLWRLAAGVVLSIAVLSGCKKQPAGKQADEEPGIYISNYDTAADFGSYRTFAVTDSLDIIQDNELFGRECTSFDSIVLHAVTVLMQERGYQLTDRSGHPDLAINVARVYSDYTGVFSYVDYWSGYFDYYDPGHWGYPGYGYYSSYSPAIYAIENGALSIDLLDLKNAARSRHRIRSIWSGLARGEAVFNATNAVAETSALFGQSAYIKAAD
ncbi:MAG: DUF4136 domain-containing protein [Puia sp.]|nr:DUF4136 domain-containing protein [Puia sp.]